MNPACPLNRKLDEFQSRCGRFEGEENPLIEPWFLSLCCLQLVTVPTIISKLTQRVVLYVAQIVECIISGSCCITLNFYVLVFADSLGVTSLKKIVKWESMYWYQPQQGASRNCAHPRVLGGKVLGQTQLRYRLSHLRVFLCPLKDNFNIVPLK
jgi:hypothetical protein